MKNQVFQPDELEVLLNPEKWHIIASFLPSSMRNASENSRWSREHTETHNFRELLFVTSGRSARGYCGKSYAVKPGTVMLMHTMEPHDCGYPQDDPPSRQLLFSFLRDKCSVNLYRVGGVNTCRGRETLWYHVYPMMSLGLASADMLFLNGDSNAPVSIVRQRCVQAVQLLITSLVEKSFLPDVLEYRDGAQERTILFIMEHIRQRNGKDCQLEYLSRVTGYSKFHFSRLFQQHARVSLREYVNQTRVEAFKQMLAQKKPLRVIAHDLGFSHQSAFHRWRRKNGV